MASKGFSAFQQKNITFEFYVILQLLPIPKLLLKEVSRHIQKSLIDDSMQV